ncbi:MAG: amidohydrolase family protein [Actinobacteria bacterium]|nr:amidohydrolase family protein [Actinomycetota bacterium]
MSLDIVIRGGLLVDGSGRRSFQADIGIIKDRIAEVGNLSDASASRTIEAGGQVICPGFINIHSHDERYIIRPDYLKIFEPYLRQGITTSVIGNCGSSLAPWLNFSADLRREMLIINGLDIDFEPQWETQADFHTYLRRHGLPLNMVPLAAYGPIRVAAMGVKNCFSSSKELKIMKNLLRESLEAGCRGFSTGLPYFPGIYAHTNEIIELAKIATEYGVRYVTHVRGQSTTYDRAVGEAIEIAEHANCALQLSHVGAAQYLGRMATLFYHTVKFMEAINRSVPIPGLPNKVLVNALHQVDMALERGIDIGMDFAPYTMGNTSVAVLYPPWARQGGINCLIERLRDTRTRQLIRHDMEKIRPTWPPWEHEYWPDNFINSWGWRAVRILSVKSEKNSSMQGYQVVDLARAESKHPFDFLADLTIEEDGCINILIGLPSGMWTQKVNIRAQNHPQLSVGLDTIWPNVGDPPPSAYGCFPRIFSHYVRELKMYTIENAVYRCTGLAASRFNLEKRGRIYKGAYADIVVFDAHSIKDNATFDNPRCYPDGINYVLVNGQLVIEKGRYVGDKLSGRLLA